MEYLANIQGMSFLVNSLINEYLNQMSQHTLFYVAYYTHFLFIFTVQASIDNPLSVYSLSIRFSKRSRRVGQYNSYDFAYPS